MSSRAVPHLKFEDLDKEFNVLRLNYYRILLDWYRRDPTVMDQVPPPIPPLSLRPQLTSYLLSCGMEDLVNLQHCREAIEKIVANLEKELDQINEEQYSFYLGQIELLDRQIQRLI